MQQRSVSELVKLYQEGGGADDFAGPALESRGEEARVQLIRMLDDPSITEEDASTIIQILLIHFPVQDSYEGIDRYGKRIQDATKRAKYKGIIEAFKANDRRKQ